MSRSVNLHSELQQFKQDLVKDPALRSRIILKEGVSWQLFRMLPLDDKKAPKNNFYCIDKTEVIGEGSFGQVYKAYRVLETKEIVQQNELVRRGEILKEDRIREISHVQENGSIQRETLTFKKETRLSEDTMLIKRETLEAGSLDFSKSYVVKEIACTSQSTKENIMTEVEILAQHYKTDVVQHVKTLTSNDYFVFTEYVPGKPLFCDSTNRVHEGVARLSMVDRLELIVQLIIQVNGLHHHRIKRKSVAHFDIRGDNLLLDISCHSSGKKTVRLSLIDFGTAVFFDSDNPTILREGKRGGMYSCFPPEYLPLQGEASIYHIGLKQDSYALTPFVAILLGSQDPFRLKDDASGRDFWTLREKRNKTEAEKQLFVEKLKAHIQASYDLKDVLDNAVYPYPYPQEIKQLMIDFLNRMKSSDYHTRPDSDELLVFFTTMRNFFKAYNDYKKLENYLGYLSQQPERRALYQILKKASIPECHRQFIQWLKKRKGSGFEAFFNQEFSARYKAKCHLSFLGNMGRSAIGKKVMQGVYVTSVEILQHVRHHQDGLASQILYDMRSSLTAPATLQDDDELLSIRQVSFQVRR